MTPPAGGAVTGWRSSFKSFGQRRLWLLILACCVVWTALAARLASTYYLEVPIQSDVNGYARVYFAYERNAMEQDADGEEVLASRECQPVRFRLRGQTLYGARLDPEQGDRPISLGAAVVRCEADDLLGRDEHHADFPVTDISPIADIQSAEVRDGRLHIVPAPGSTGPITSIVVRQPIPLGLDWPGFLQLLLRGMPGSVLVAVGLYYGGVCLNWWMGSYAGHLLPGLPGRDAQPAFRWERRAIGAVFLLSLLVQCDAVLHHGAVGQDPSYNQSNAKEYAREPGLALKFHLQDPPGAPLINAAVWRLTGGIHALEVCGITSALVNVLALWLFYLLARRFVGRAVWRVTLLVLVAFLPLRLIHTVVLASDAYTLLPMFALAWVLMEITGVAATPARRRWLAGAAGALLLLCLLIKFTFVSAVVAVALTLVQLPRRGLATWRQTVLLLAVALLPAFLLVGTVRRLNPQFGSSLGVGSKMISNFSYADVLSFTRADRHIFAAPAYIEPLHPADRAAFRQVQTQTLPPYELLTNHRHGYLALVHLGTFTDLINIFQYDPADFEFGQRTARNQHLMSAAAKLGVPVTLLCVLCMALVCAAAIPVGVCRPEISPPGLEAVLLLALGWFGNIVVFLPFVHQAYYAGYWTPRLILPALLLFLLLSVYLLDRSLRGRAGSVAGWVALAFVASQAVLHVSFLWPWGSM